MYSPNVPQTPGGAEGVGVLFLNPFKNQPKQKTWKSQKKTLKKLTKSAPSHAKNEVLDGKTKIVLRTVNLELVYPKPQLDQILKAIRILFCTKFYI